MKAFHEVSLTSLTLKTRTAFFFNFWQVADNFANLVCSLAGNWLT